MPGLERLIYESEATGSTGSLLNMAAILAEAQRNNERHGLTGALAAHRERFIQVLEGAPQQLDRLLRRLEGDPRHRGLKVIDRFAVTERLFEGWTMASARIAPEQGPELDRLMAEPQPSGPRITGLLKQAIAT